MSIEKEDWKEIGQGPYGGRAFRLKVPGGWLVRVGDDLAFYPDPKHEWKPEAGERDGNQA